MKPELHKLPVSGIVALAAIVFFCVCLTLAIVSYPPPFSPLENWMSDLGNPRLNPSGSAFFNWACMITGLSLIFFYLGLSRWRSGDGRNARMLTAAQAMGMFSGIALAGVGYFPEIFEPHHYIVSVLFFLSSTLAILLTTLALRGRRGFGSGVTLVGYLTVAVGFIFAIQMALLDSVTIVEWVSVLSMLAWAALIGADMLRARG